MHIPPQAENTTYKTTVALACVSTCKNVAIFRISGSYLTDNSNVFVAKKAQFELQIVSLCADGVVVNITTSGGPGIDPRARQKRRFL